MRLVNTTYHPNYGTIQKITMIVPLQAEISCQAQMKAILAMTKTPDSESDEDEYDYSVNTFNTFSVLTEALPADVQNPVRYDLVEQPEHGAVKQGANKISVQSQPSDSEKSDGKNVDFVNKSSPFPPLSEEFMRKYDMSRSLLEQAIERTAAVKASKFDQSLGGEQVQNSTQSLGGEQVQNSTGFQAQLGGI